MLAYIGSKFVLEVILTASRLFLDSPVGPLDTGFVFAEREVSTLDEIPLHSLLVAFVVLLLISAFFSISETSMMALNRYRLKHLAKTGNRGARLTAQLLARTDKLLGVVLLGNNLVNAAAAALGTVIAFRVVRRERAGASRSPPWRVTFFSAGVQRDHPEGDRRRLPGAHRLSRSLRPHAAAALATRWSGSSTCSSERCCRCCA